MRKAQTFSSPGFVITQSFRIFRYKVFRYGKGVRFGPLDLGDLRRGEWRELSAEEIAKLKAL